MIHQVRIALPKYTRGMHLITDVVIDKLPPLPEKGLLNLFIQHTSAALTINENADPSVRVDLDEFFNRIVPENQSWFTHTMEGADDMPAHIKTSTIGFSLQIPICNGMLCLGTWQGIYLCEFRNRAGSRSIVATILT